jgi:hypothetical protein
MPTLRQREFTRRCREAIQESAASVTARAALSMPVEARSSATTRGRCADSPGGDRRFGPARRPRRCQGRRRALSPADRRDYFRGPGRLARHRLIHAALGDLLQTRIHALSIQASDPGGSGIDGDRFADPESSTASQYPPQQKETRHAQALQTGQRPAARRAHLAPGDCCRKGRGGDRDRCHRQWGRHSAKRRQCFVAEQKAQGAPDSPELKKAVREELIRRELLVQEAKKLGLDKNPDVAAQLTWHGRRSTFVPSFRISSRSTRSATNNSRRRTTR